VIIRPEAPVTINMGSEMPSWFDIRSLEKFDGNEDDEGIKKASKDIIKMIDQEVRFNNHKQYMTN
jgi:predicted esterase